MSDKTKTIVGTVLFLGVTVGFIYFLATERVAIALALMGFLFFALGLMGIITKGISGENWGVLIVLIAGAGVMVVSLSYAGVPFLDMIRKDEKIVPTLLSVFFILVGVISFFGSIYTDRYRKNRCTYQIQAQCIAIHVRNVSTGSDDIGSNRNHIYIPEWKYIYGGKEYRYKSSFGSNSWSKEELPKVNESYPIMINPSNPEEAYYPEDHALIVWRILGIAAIAMGAVMFYFARYYGS